MKLNPDKLEYTLRALEKVDPQGINPYVGLYFPEEDSVDQILKFYRFGMCGFAQSVDIPDLDDNDWVFVDFNRLREMVKILLYAHPDTIEILKEENRITVSIDKEGFDSVLRANIVDRDRVGIKLHNIGDNENKYDYSFLYQLVTLYPSKATGGLTTPPILKDKKLMFLFAAGCVISDIEIEEEPSVSPRESFLEFLSGDLYSDIDYVGVTDRRYYVVKTGGKYTDPLIICFAGHKVNENLLGLFDSEGDLVCSIPTDKFLFAMHSLISLSDPSVQVIKLNKSGYFTIVDRTGNLSKFKVVKELEEDIEIFQKSCKLASDTINQIHTYYKNHNSPNTPMPSTELYKISDDTYYFKYRLTRIIFKVPN